MRGKGKKESEHNEKTRITPAYAGKRYGERDFYKPFEDHPRVCGEKQKCYFIIDRPIGSPPRMRGKGLKISAFNCSFGITPAYAGKRL